MIVIHNKLQMVMNTVKSMTVLELLMRCFANMISYIDIYNIQIPLGNKYMIFFTEFLSKDFCLEANKKQTTTTTKNLKEYKSLK